MSEIPAAEPTPSNNGKGAIARTPAGPQHNSGSSAAKGNGHAVPLSPPTVRFLLVRTGCTDYDQQRRLKGRLDIPLNDEGTHQAAQTAQDTSGVQISSVYSAPCRASLQTAERIAATVGAKVKPSSDLQNLDHGLWEGKLIDEVKLQQPKVYRRWQEQPETVCPPQGEMLDDARRRLIGMVDKALKKHKSGVIAFVLPEPLATVLSCQLQGKELGDLWQTEKNSGKWELIEYRGDVVADKDA
jgi:broad specificity phosphatase PhoE